MIKSKPLPTNSKLNELFEYDPNTGNLIRKKTVNYNAKKGSTAGFIRKSDGYWHIAIRGSYYLAHRLIWQMQFGEIPQGMYIDHINGITSDNRLENLRLVEHHINMKNQPVRRSNRSGVTGVSLIPSSKRWRALIQHNGKSVHLGCFINKQAAIKARQEAEVRFGYKNRS